MQLEHISRIGLLEFFQLSSDRGHLCGGGNIYFDPGKDDIVTDHQEHLLHDVLFHQNRKRNMNVILNTAKHLIETR
jgi:hypothetical protein